MSMFLICILFFHGLYGLNINPYSMISYNRDSELYSLSDSKLTKVRLGIKYNYLSDDFSLESDLSYNIFIGSDILFDDFNSSQGLGKVEQSPGLSSNQYNYFLATIESKYNLDEIELYVNISSPKWGPGQSNIILSDKVPPYFNIGYIWKITDNISYEHMYGSLISMIEDESYDNLYSSSNRTAQYKRNIFSHRLSFDIYSKLSLSLYEMIIYGGNRGIEPYYMIPLVPFLPIQTYLGDIDNDLIGVSFEYQPTNNINTYFTLVIDEWSPPYTFKEKHKNWFVYHFGTDINNLLKINDALRFEYVWSELRVYKHRFNINDYYSYDYPLGFWAGPHAEQFNAFYKITYQDIALTAGYLFAKRGAVTESIATEKYSNDFYYERYSDGYEKKRYNHSRFWL